MKRILLFAAMGAAAYAQTAADSPTGNRTTPPTINSISPSGVPRGATIEMNVEGLNLAKTSAIYFSEPGVKARILRIKELADLPDIRIGSNGTPSTVDLGPLPPRNRAGPWQAATRPSPEGVTSALKLIQPKRHANGGTTTLRVL